MADRRKLQGEIDRCHKKVQEGVEIFEDIWQKAHNAPNINQKEKYEGDLKKEIKKLQRLRDQIKTWIASSEIKDKRLLLDDRKLIETQMERFKVLERETKTKAYSKEGLGAAQKLDPAQREKEDLCNWITTSIESLNIQIDQFESEIESISVHLRKKKNDKDKQERVEKLKSSVDKHKYHINQLETLMRMLDNSTIDVHQVKGIKDDVDYYIESSQDPDFEENEFIYEDLELEDITEFLNKSKMNNTSNSSSGNKDLVNNHSTSFENNKSGSSINNNLVNNINDDEGTNSLQSTTHTSPSISPAPSPGFTKSELNNDLNNDKLIMNNNFYHNSFDNFEKTSIPESCTASNINNSSSSLFNSAQSVNSVWSHSIATTNSVNCVTTTSSSTTASGLSNNAISKITSLESSINPINNSILPSNFSSISSLNNSQEINTNSFSKSYENSTSLYAVSAVPSATQSNNRLNQDIENNKNLDNLPDSYSNSIINNNVKDDTVSNGPLTLPQQSTSPQDNSSSSSRTNSNAFTTDPIILQQHQLKSQLSPQQLSNVTAADLYHAAGVASSSTLASSAWNNLNSIVNSRPTLTSTSNNQQILNGPISNVSSKDEQKLTSLKTMAQQAIERIDNQENNQEELNNFSRLQQQQQQKQQQQQQANQIKQTNHQKNSQVYEANPAVSNASSLPSNASLIGLLNSSSPKLILHQIPSHKLEQKAPQTNEAVISPMLGVAPLGPVSLTKQMVYQTHMLESAGRHVIHPIDSQRTRTYLPVNAYPTPSYYPQQALPKSDTLEFFDRLSTETLFFIFYFMEGTKAQFLAAKTLKKQSWRFHTKFMMWFQRHEEPKSITDEYEQGTYIYFDYEKWGQRKKEHFTFEYRYLEDRDLN